MKHRIRGAAIIRKEDKVLLVKHVHPVKNHVWWVPPGGKIEEKDNSIFHAIKREVWEETGLKVTLSENFEYIREFYDHENKTLNLELFVIGEVISGELTIKNIKGNGPDEEYIKEVSWLTKDAVQKLTVFPEIIQDDIFWKKSGDNHKSYLGRQEG